MLVPALAIVAVLMPIASVLGAQSRHETVRFAAGADTLGGTLTIPVSNRPAPAVLMLSGAGADDRDATTGRFRPFKVLADTLSAYGFAVLRYDDRGVGETGGRHMWEYTVAEHQEEVRGALALLRNRPDIDASSIFLLGHSYGTVMAGLAASTDHSVRGLVLLSPNRGLTASQIDLQIARATARGRTLAQAAEAAHFESTTVAVAGKSGQGWPEVEAEMHRRAREEYASLSDSMRTRYPTFERFFAITVDSFTLTFGRRRFFQSFYNHDVLGTARRVNEPVLLIWGDADSQTPPRTNLAPLVAAYRASGNSDVTTRVVPGGNHYLRTSASPPDAFAPGVPTDIAKWLTAQAPRR